MVTGSTPGEAMAITVQFCAGPRKSVPLFNGKSVAMAAAVHVQATNSLRTCVCSTSQFGTPKGIKPQD